MVVLPWTFARRGAETIKTDCFHLHVFRSLAGLGAMYCFFYAISHLKLSEAFLLMSTSPLFIPIIAFVWLGESASKRIRWAIIIGFVGVALILKPGFGIFKPAALVGLGTGILSAMAMVSIRRMSNTEPAVRIVFYFTVLAAVVSLVPLAWTWKAPSAALWPLLLLMGAMAAFGQLLLTKGYSLAPAAQVGAFMYANVFFATLMGWTFWEETLDVLSVAGALLIIAAGIITTRRTSAPAAACDTPGELTESATNFSAISTDSLGSPRLSATSMMICLPWIPPIRLTRSNTIVTARLKSLPYSAQSPVSGAERPTLTVCPIAIRGAAEPAITSDTATVIHNTKRLLNISSSFGWS